MRRIGAASLAPILRPGCVAAAAHGQEAPRAPSWCSGSPAPGCAPPPQRPGRRSRRAPAPDPAASARARRPPLRWRPAHRRGARLQCPASHALPAGRKRASGLCPCRQRCPSQCQVQLRLRMRAACRFGEVPPTSAVRSVSYACDACRPGAGLQALLVQTAPPQTRARLTDATSAPNDLVRTRSVTARLAARAAAHSACAECRAARSAATAPAQSRDDMQSLAMARLSLRAAARRSSPPVKAPLALAHMLSRRLWRPARKPLQQERARSGHMQGMRATLVHMPTRAGRARGGAVGAG